MSEGGGHASSFSAGAVAELYGHGCVAHLHAGMVERLDGGQAMGLDPGAISSDGTGAIGDDGNGVVVGGDLGVVVATDASMVVAVYRRVVDRSADGVAAHRRVCSFPDDHSG